MANHRTHGSEIDMTALRRISDALLLAQNRARLSTERANRYERLFRVVLTRMDINTAEALRLELERPVAVDGGSDWEVLQTSEESTVVSRPNGSLTNALIQNYQLLSPRRRRHSFHGSDSMMDSSDNEVLTASTSAGAVTTSSIASTLSPSLDVSNENARLAKEIVDNLYAAANRHDRQLEGFYPMQSRPSTAYENTDYKLLRWLEVWKASIASNFSPLQFMAGLLVGVVVGMTVTKRFLVGRHGGHQGVLKTLARCFQRQPVADDYACRLLNIPMDDFYLPPAFEVA